MTTLELPRRAAHPDVASAIAEADLWRASGGHVAFELPEGCFLTSDGIALLAAWGLLHVQRGGSVAFSGCRDACDYLSRMDVFRALGFDYEERFRRRAAAGRFLPVALVGGDSDVQPAVDGICEVVARQFDNAREFLPALEWAVQEMVDNIITHADSPVPGVVIAQYFPKKHRLAVAICDMGRGLKRALEQSFELWSHGDAITKALEKGVTRSKEIGMGFGLAGTLQISRLNGGRFWIWTGDASCFLAGDSRRFRPLPTAPGTGVAFTLDTRRPVPMTKTFMGEPTQTYFETQSEKVAELGGLRVLDEVASTGTRRSARALRRKVEGILPEMDRPLVLDFDGVARTTSSFLDELLGRLVASLGAEDWRRRVRIQGLRPEFQALANTVIHERIRIEADPNVR